MSAIRQSDRRKSCKVQFVGSLDSIIRPHSRNVGVTTRRVPQRFPQHLTAALPAFAPCWKSCLWVGLALVLAPVGCGHSGHTRFELSGTVTYDGQPVPVGYIVFTPDKAAGNPGPGSQADIHDGKYSTPSGLGTIGGPHVVTVFGFDGKSYVPPGATMPIIMGHPLFPSFTVKLNLPKAAGVQDLTVPTN
jgi:hypothetical protein